MRLFSKSEPVNPAASVPSESISNRGTCGLLLNFRLLFLLHSRIPANEGLPELVIERLRPDLQYVVRAGLSPSHLLLLHHALADVTGKNRGLRRLRIACLFHSRIPTRERRAPVLIQNFCPHLK